MIEPSHETDVMWPEMLAFELDRANRHSFMNDVQVIMGWLQLQEPAQAMDHVKAMVDRVRHEREQMARLPDQFAPLLWPWISLARRRGMAVELAVDGVAVSTDLPLTALRSCLGEVLPVGAGLGDGELTIVLAATRLSVTYRKLGDNARSLYNCLTTKPNLAHGRAVGSIDIQHQDDQVTITMPIGEG